MYSTSTYNFLFIEKDTEDSISTDISDDIPGPSSIIEVEIHHNR